MGGGLVTSKQLNPHLGVRRRKPFEILTIARQDLGSFCFDGLGHDEGIHG
jgi:hypothetical protein